MKKSLKILICLVLSASALLCASCGKGQPPVIDDVKDIFQDLIEKSYEINDIFFGEGLPVYDRETSSGDGNAIYDEDAKVYYYVLPDDTYTSVIKFCGEDRVYKYAALSKSGKNELSKFSLDLSVDGFITLNEGTEYRTFAILDSYTEPDRPLVYDEDSPKYYDYVVETCKYQSVEDIKALASTVYSADYLQSVYVIMFDGYATDTSIVYARYMASDTNEFFMKSNRFNSYFTEQTKYDYTSMKIVKPSNATTVNVQITASGYKLNTETLETELQTYTRNLRFSFENNEWRLDTPTY